MALFWNTAGAVDPLFGFSSTVTPGLIETFEKRFGKEASARIGSWQKTVKPQVNDTSSQTRKMAMLERVNTYFNSIPFLEDHAHWNVADYWATPAELVASHGGDCEDYSIAKYFALKELGIPVTQLRIVYVTATRINRPHMVLAWYPSADAEPFILDNLETAVRPASQRPDLIPVYSFNDEDLWLANGELARPSDGSKQIRLWRELINKLERELTL